jgi:hypothetical protein
MHPMCINEGLELIYFIWVFFCIIGIPKLVIMALVDVTSFAKIIVNMSFRCMSFSFCKPNHLTFIMCMFNMPCGIKTNNYLKY